MFGKRLAAVVALAGLLMCAPRADAGGWQEMHETSDDVRIEVGADGVANVRHHLRYRIVAGHFKSFDLVGVDPRGELSPAVVFTPEKGGAEVVAHVVPVPSTPGTLRVTIDEGNGLTRGAYVLALSYRLDLVAAKMLVRDGAMWKLSWTSPPAPEGHDGARVVFDLPSASTEPRLAARVEATTTLATLRRGTSRDELELVRAHVPRGEAVTWTARVDPKAFPLVSTPELRPPVHADVQPLSLVGVNLESFLVWLGFAVLAGACALLLHEKQKGVRAASAMRHARARPLLPLPWGAGPFAYGIATSGSLAMLLWWSPVVGALLVGLAMALSAHRSPAPIARRRGPGSWHPVSDRQVWLGSRVEPLPTDGLDLATMRARIVFATLVGIVVGVSWLLRPWVPQIAIALPLTSAVLLPVFFTGTRAQLLPTPTDLASRLLRPARDALASAVDLTHVEIGTIGRFVGTEARSVEPEAIAIDELRLTCAPRDRTPGLRVIELAARPPSEGYGAAPEVLVRFDDASPAGERVAGMMATSPVVPGRTPEERVVRLAPSEPTPRAAAALVAKLLLALEGRRETDREGPRVRRAPWRGPERRGPGRSRSGSIGIPTGLNRDPRLGPSC